MKFLSSLFISCVLAETQILFQMGNENENQVIIDFNVENGHSFSLNMKQIGDFCVNDGYWISNFDYPFYMADIVCDSIGKKPVLFDEENFNSIGFSLAVCKGENSNAWIGGDEKCTIYNAETYFCGSVFTISCEEEELPVICK